MAACRSAPIRRSGRVHAVAAIGALLLATSVAGGPPPLSTAAPSADPDLTVTRLDRSAVTGDWQALVVGGELAVTVGNRGAAAGAGPFALTVFADTDVDGQFARGTDTVLGEVTVADLAEGESRQVRVPIAGTVTFRDDLMHAMVDSAQVVAESDESNNVRHTGQECAFRPSAGSFRPEIEWQWSVSGVLPASRQVIGTPVVIDLDGDGVPEVVFGTFTGQEYWGHGHLRAVRGDDGREVFTVTDNRYDIAGGGNLAAADIDGDRRPEIIAVASVAVPTGGHNVLVLLAFEHDGTFKWRSPSIQGGGDWGGSAIADLEGDGVPEIIIGNTVLDAAGRLRWEGPRSGGRGDGWNGPLSLVVDLDLDDRPEIVGGNTAYRGDGSVLWNSNLADGFNAVADFDGDGYPDIALVNAGQVNLLGHDGRRIWGPVTLPGGTDRGAGGAPTIGDMDGDGRPEIGVAGGRAYAVIDTNGRILWSKTTDDRSSGSTGSSVFDFEGDGSVEVVYGDEGRLRVYRGSDGQVLWDVPRPDATGYDNT
jgi:hypothetical protein